MDRLKSCTLNELDGGFELVMATTSDHVDVTLQARMQLTDHVEAIRMKLHALELARDHIARMAATLRARLPETPATSPSLPDASG
jgi:hypothetical protein